MFRRVVLSFGTRYLQLFVCKREPIDAYAAITDLAAAFGMQPEAVRERLSGPLVKLPELTVWLSSHHCHQNDIAYDTNSPTSSSNTPLYFAPSAAWKMFVKSRVSSSV